MRRVLFALAAAAALLSIAAEALPGDQDAPRDEVRADWLRKDLANAKRTLAILPPADTTVDAFLDKLGSSDVREDRPTGFGGRRVRVSDYGGYTSSWIDIAAFDDRVIAIEIRVEASRDRWPAVREELTKAWGKAFEGIERGRRYRWEDPAGVAKHNAALEKALGKAPVVDVPADLADAVALLTSPLRRLDVGKNCYYAGTAPRGRQATDTLVARERHDLLRRVLRGPNPGGRVYAARALLDRAAKGQPLPPADRRAIDVIRASAVPISACSGCTVFESTAAKLLR